jgi:hypothetical protein
MCQAVARHLRPGGRFVTINNNPPQPVETFPLTRKYGFVKSTPGTLREGAPITYTNYFPDGRSFTFDNYYLDVQTHERALADAGLKDVRWHAPQLSPEGEKEFGREFWDDFLTYQPIIFLDASK